jgi:hypothetical protein
MNPLGRPFGFAALQHESQSAATVRRRRHAGNNLLRIPLVSKDRAADPGALERLISTD